MRMNDNKYDWVGSIFCEFTHQIEIQAEDAQKIMHQAANAIQYLLPEYKGTWQHPDLSAGNYDYQNNHQYRGTV